MINTDSLKVHVLQVHPHFMLIEVHVNQSHIIIIQKRNIDPKRVNAIISISQQHGSHYVIDFSLMFFTNISYPLIHKRTCAYQGDKT